MSAKTVIQKFGGVRSMAAKMTEVGQAQELRHKRVPPTTVQYWSDEDVIPSGRQDHVLRTARYFNIDMEPAEMLAVSNESTAA